MLLLRKTLNLFSSLWTAWLWCTRPWVWRSTLTKLRLFSSSREWSQVITINGDELKNVPHFKYLGSILAGNCSMDEEVNNRINSAASAFARIRSRVIRSHDLRIQTKSAVYRAICLSTLLYCCETWTLHRRHVKRLERFHIQCVRKILGVTWQNRVPYVELLSRAGLSSIECMLLRAQLRWVGHVFRMPDFRYPRQN